VALIIGAAVLANGIGLRLRGLLRDRGTSDREQQNRCENPPAGNLHAGLFLSSTHDDA
jgi:hypothetical protein